MKQRQSFSSTFRKRCRDHFFCSSQWKAGNRGNTWTPTALLVEAEESEIVGYPSLQSDWRSSLSLKEWKKRTRRWWARRDRSYYMKKTTQQNPDMKINQWHHKAGKPTEQCLFEGEQTEITSVWNRLCKLNECYLSQDRNIGLTFKLN